MKFNAYQEAEKVDNLIQDILEKFKIDKNNSRDWSLFTRTVRTTLDIIDSTISEKIECG